MLLALVFYASSVEAARGPVITHKVYFDIKHGDKDLGRGGSFTPVVFTIADHPFLFSCHGSLWWSMSETQAMKLSADP